MSSRSIPEEICVEIFLRLPVKSACVCKCVCKNWFSLISNPRFAKSHLNLTIQKNKSSLIFKGTDLIRICGVMYSVSHDSIPSFLSSDEEFPEYAVEMDYPFKSSLLCPKFKLVGCCDGLVCLLLYFVDNAYKGLFCLWNPATKEYKKLSESPNAKSVRNFEDYFENFSMIGLCYDCKTEDYKIVTRCFHSGVEVYSLVLNSWTSIGNVPYEFFDFREVGLLVNGDLHWLAKAQDSSQVVVSLDISSHIFNQILLPKEALMVMDRNDRCMTLGALEGCLCLLVNVPRIRSEVWIMQDYGVHESWTKLFSISIAFVMPCLLRSFWFPDSRDLFIYDPKDGSLRKQKMPSSLIVEQGEFYYESLVSLRSGTYVGREEEEEDDEDDEDKAMGRM